MYPADLAADVVLADGGTVHIRPIRPDDAARIVALHARLSAQSIYYRFFSPRPRLSERDLERFTNVDYTDRLALIALLGDDMVAVSRYDRYGDTDEAEVAFLVDDAHHGRGLGTVLLEHLAAAARARGINRFAAQVLPENRKMIGVFKDAGFEVATRFADGIVEVRLVLEPTEASALAMAERERVAEAASVARLLAPRSVAVIGASRQPGSIGHEVFRNLLAGGFAGPVYPVNPGAPYVASVRTWATILDVPDDVDVAVVAVPAAAVPGVVDECGRKRVRGLVILSAGFADAGPAGAEAERRLVESARGHGVRVIGPNCMGIVNTAPDVRLHATFAPVRPPAGGVALSSQSGALGAAILSDALRLDVGISTFVAVGNKADVSGNDLLQFWESDARTQVVLLYLESFGNPRKFSRIARRVSRHKPIVAVKAAVAGGGADVAVDALFRQTGVIRVDSMAQLFDVARVLVSQPLPAGRGVGIVSNAPGPGALAADACVAGGLEVVRAEELSHTSSLDDYRDAVAEVAADPSVDALLTLYVPPLATGLDEAGRAVAEVAAHVQDKPVVANFLAMGPGLEALRVGDRVVPSFAYPEEAVHTLAVIAEYADWRRRPPGVVPDLPGVDVDRARHLVGSRLASSPAGVTLGLPEAGELLACFGLSVAGTEEVADADGAVAAAERLGYPVAVKLGGTDPVHLGEAGGVAIDLHDAGEVARAWAAMAETFGERMAAAVVQRMARPGVDLSAGVVPHPSFGPLVRIGLGGRAIGVAVEYVHRIVPVTDADAADLVRTVHGSILLEPVASVVEDLLLRIGLMADELPELTTLRLEPVIATPEGTVAVDVELTLAPATVDPADRTRRLG